MNWTRFITLIALCLFNTLLRGQEIGIGEWRSHSQFDGLSQLYRVNTQLFGVNEYHAFVLDLSTDQITVLSKVNALSDSEISFISGYQEKDIIAIGYANGNLDLIEEGVTRNIALLKNATIEGNKKITNILFKNELLYLVTSVGVFVLDFEKEELLESYRELGPAAQTVSILGSVLNQDSLFLNTDFGLIGAPLSTTVNLQDFNSWRRIETPGGMQDIVSIVEEIYGRVGDEIYRYANGQWLLLSSSTRPVRRLIELNDQPALIHDNGYSVINTNIIFNTLPTTMLNDIEFTTDKIYVADQQRGFLVLDGNEITEPLVNFIELPVVLSTLSADNKTYALGDGSFDLPILENGVWTNTQVDGRAVGVAYLPANRKTYAAVKDNGVFCLEDGQFDEIPSLQPEEISAIVVDANGDLWVAQQDASAPLFKRNTDGSWQPFSFNTQGSEHIKEIKTDGFGLLWCLLEDVGGVFVFDPINDREMWLRAGNSNLPSDIVNDLTVDEDNQIWFGTDRGVVFLPFPPDVFSTDVTLFQPIFGNRVLFEDEKINALTADPGNRKWIATEEQLWLLEEDGGALVSSFTTDNSPLPSNDIIDIGINEDNGEVFITTASGLMSYRGNAIRGSAIHAEKLKIFPNPVPPGFGGEIGIYGTARDASLKITDASGNLVREVMSQGGSASWDLRDFNGTRAEAGVYFIFSANRDGSDTLVGKFAIVN